MRVSLDRPLWGHQLLIGVIVVPVFLRWLIFDYIVIRILRHRRIRPYAQRTYPLLARASSRDGGQVYTVPAGGRDYFPRRRHSCLSGCLVLLASLALGLVLFVALLHWLF